MTKSRQLAYLAMLGNIIIWGAALPIVKPSLSIISPYQFLFLRFISVVPILFILSIKPLKKLLHKPAQIGTILIASLLGNAALLALYMGLDHTSALEGSFITTIQPVIITLAGILLLREREDKHEWIGLGLSLFGSLIILITPSLNTGLALSGNAYGNILIGLWALLSTINIIIVKKYLQKLSKSLLVTIDSIIATVMFGFLTLQANALPHLSKLLDPSVLLAVFYMGILGTIVAFYLHYYGYQRIEASEATLFTYLQPLVYIPLAVLWLKDTLLPLQLVGLVIVIVGVYIAERRPNVHPNHR